jgi:hypothetical protein
VDGELVARCGVAAALAGSALVHSTVVSEHFAEWRTAGMFFIALELVEMVLAIAVVLAWTRLVQLAVVVTSVGTVLVWTLSRTVGMPIGPADFRQPEVVGVSDLACCVLELAAAALVLPWLLRRRATPHSFHTEGGRRQSRTWLPAAVLVAAALAVTAWGLSPAVARPDTPAGGTHHTH